MFSFTAARLHELTVTQVSIGFLADNTFYATDRFLAEKEKLFQKFGMINPVQP